MGIFKSKEKLYRLEVEGGYFSHSEGNLNLKELILKASENDPQLPIHKLVRSIELGMLEMKADEYTDLEAERKADIESFKSLRNAKVIIESSDDVFYKQVKELKLESLPFKIQNLYKRFEEARKLTAFEVSLCRGNRISDEAEEASSKFYKLGHELHDLICKELRDKREACLKCHDRGLTGTDVEKLLKVQYEALQDLLKVVKKHVYP